MEIILRCFSCHETFVKRQEIVIHNEVRIVMNDMREAILEAHMMLDHIQQEPPHVFPKRTAPRKLEKTL